MTELEACYDRQLPNIGSVTQESTEVERKIMQLLIKVIPCFEHYICTSYDTSKVFCSRLAELLAGTSQGNVLSSSIC